jgi:hypothetical protein
MPLAVAVITAVVFALRAIERYAQMLSGYPCKTSTEPSGTTQRA